MNATIHRPTDSRRGGALVVSLVLVTLVATLGAGLIRIQTSITRRHVQSIDKKRALYIAEAGIAEAFSAVSIGKSGDVGSEDEPAAYAGGYYWVEAEEDDEGRVELKSTGLCGTGRFSVGVVLQRDVNPAALNGLFGNREVLVGAGTVVDGYDSRQGDYESQLDPSEPVETTGGGARVTSNSDVTLEGDLVLSLGVDTTVYGDVRPGVDATVVMDPGVTVTGATTPASGPSDMPPVPVPQMDQVLAPLSAALRSPVTLVDDALSYESLTVQAGGTLTLQGPLTLVVGALDVAPEGTLAIDSTNGSVMVYVTERLLLPAGSIVTSVDRQPTRVGLFLGELGMNELDLAQAYQQGKFEAGEFGGTLVPGPNEEDPAVYVAPDPTNSLVLAASGAFHGLVYAPFSDLTLPASLRVFGAVAARRVATEEDARFTYDVALATAGIGVESLPRILSWTIDDLPDSPLVKLRVDPLVAMQMAGITPVDSSVAHKENEVRMAYVDLGGNSQLFVGDVNTFDWTLCQAVESVSWRDPDTGTYSVPKVPPGAYSGLNYLKADPAKTLGL